MNLKQSKLLWGLISVLVIGELILIGFLIKPYFSNCQSSETCSTRYHKDSCATEPSAYPLEGNMDRDDRVVIMDDVRQLQLMMDGVLEAMTVISKENPNPTVQKKMKELLSQHQKFKESLNRPIEDRN